MPSDPFDFVYKVFVLRRIDTLRLVVGDLPSRREMDIQVEKLWRMAWGFAERFSKHRVTTISMKKLRKMKGADMHRLVQQSKRVDALLTRLLEEGFKRSLLKKNRALYKSLLLPAPKKGAGKEVDPAARKRVALALKERAQDVVRYMNKENHNNANDVRLSFVGSFKKMEKVAGFIASGDSKIAEPRAGGPGC